MDTGLQPVMCTDMKCRNLLRMFFEDMCKGITDTGVIRNNLR
jgi:hypothetical protein